MGFCERKTIAPGSGLRAVQGLVWLLQDGFEERGGAAGGVVGDLFGGALGDEVAAFGAGFGADVDEVVGFGEDVGVVLDDDDGVAFVHEAVQDVDEAFHVGHVEADGGFFDEVEVAFGILEATQALGGRAALAGGEFGDEL